MKKRSLLKSILLLFSLFTLRLVSAQSTMLDDYIKQALQHNGLIKEQRALLEEKQTGLLLAKKQFSPEVTLGTSYTLAVGGRSIDFPIGDLLNPINNALNDLTHSSKFQTLENQHVQFLPNNFYDVRARIIQPILRPEIKTNQSIKSEQISLQQLESNIVSRDLVRDVKKAYYQYIQSGQLIAILQEGNITLNEGERVTQSLIRNGVALPSTMLRLNTERSKIDNQIFTAQQQRKNAKEYFNYLLGRAAMDSILEMNTEQLPDPGSYGNEIQSDVINSIDKGITIQRLLVDLEKKYHAPRLGAQLDFGSQNFDFKPGAYALAGIQLDIPLWNNKKSSIRQDELQAGIKAAQEKKDWIIKSYELQVAQARRLVESSNTQYQSYGPLLEMSRKYYSELLKKYKEGQVNPSELIDAQSQITNAQLQQNIARYQSWINATELERLLLDKK
ncbi:MAG: TolC family protein [Saprospiraceae bacterium]